MADVAISMNRYALGDFHRSNKHVVEVLQICVDQPGNFQDVAGDDGTRFDSDAVALYLKYRRDPQMLSKPGKSFNFNPHTVS